MTDFFDKHHERLEQAIEAARTRAAWSPFNDSPSRKIHGDAVEKGLAAFQARLNQPFEIDQPGTIGRIGMEISPYTQEPLGISYPKVDVDVLYEAAREAIPAWRDAGARTRVGVCMEMAERLNKNSFECANAIMHTTGQSFPMAFAGGGPNAQERGLEAIVYAWQEMARVAESATWERAFGSTQVKMQKRYRLMPRGVALVIACATFPTWNAYPAIFANLAAGNAVIVKPHPLTILPMALAVEILRGTLRDAGLDPNLVTLVVDSSAEPIAKELVTRADTAIVDFTGSAHFGRWIEENARGKPVFTETSGVNSVVLDSTNDLKGLAQTLGMSLCLFSKQMCTSPQNVYIPRQGFRSNDSEISFDAVSETLVESINGLLSDNARAGGVLGAIQNENILHLVERAEELAPSRAKLLRESKPYAHPDFPNARTRTPVILGLDISDNDIYAREWFGPVIHFIAADSPEQALQQAASDAKQFGAINSYAYSTDEKFIERAQDAFGDAGANLSINMIGPMPLTYAAAFSDYHVSGLNPAGNATLTDASFVSGRFRIVQSRMAVP
ncbi:MAG: phenylacetic acid degradation protein PaaN [Chloroflexota bacterium]|nr:MAG: phenylacetic acid degradation protein PaaN [Chloroflexota bacterium]